MSEDSALLQAIAGGDDTARLAYADWLEERGDARAAWVRDLTVWRWMAPDAHDPVPALLAAITAPDEHWSRQSNAIAALGIVGATAVPPLLELVKQSGWSDTPAWRAGQALGAMPREAVEPILPALLELAEDDNEPVCGPAIEAMKAVGAAAAPALPSLIRALGPVCDSRHVQASAAEVLAKIGPAASEAISGLLELACESDGASDEAEKALLALGPTAAPAVLDALSYLYEDHTRFQAAKVFRQMGPDVVPYLREAVSARAEPGSDDWDDVFTARLVAGLALAAFDPDAALPVLLDGLEIYADEENWESDARFAEALRDAGPAAAPAAAKMRELLPTLSWSATRAITEALTKLGQAEEVRANLVAQLGAADAAGRAAALSALSHADEIPDRAVAAVIAFLDDDSRNNRNHATTILGRLAEGRQAPLVAPALASAACHKEEDVAQWAVGLLEKQLPAADAQAALRGCLRHALPDVRVAALNALAGPDLDDLEAEYVRLASTDPAAAVRATAVRRLGDTGPDSPARSEAIRAAFSDPEAEVRQYAAVAAGIRGMAAAYLIRAARDEPENYARRYAVDQLPSCGRPPAEVVAVLRRCLAEDPEDGVRASAAHALGLVAGRPDGGAEAARAALPELLARLGDSGMADEAAWALSRLGSAATSGLVAALRDGNEVVRQRACEALTRIGADVLTPAAVEGIVAALSSPRHQTREAAARAVAMIGPSAAEATPALRRLLWAETNDQVTAAIVALAQVGAVAAFEDLARMAGSEDGEIAATALWAASQLGERSAVTELLKSALASGREEVAAVARIELARRGEALAMSAEELFAACEVSGCRAQAMEELVRRASADPAVFEAAVRASRDGNHGRHSVGATVLARVGGQKREAAAQALASMTHSCGDHWLIAECLGECGTASRAAFAGILRRMYDYRPSSRAAGVSAMRRLLARAGQENDRTASPSSS